MAAPPFEISTTSSPSDEDLVALLHEVYVRGGHTAPELARTLLTPENVRARGALIFAHARDHGAFIGLIVLVPKRSPVRQIARDDEAELHLLAVHPKARGQGLGRALVQEALALARHGGDERLVLSTQPPMKSAQRIYEAAGFRRAPARDWTRLGREFLAYALELSP